ncbi:MAG: A/G-specific adenine glycosylase [Porticoccaceae bacterium]|nr:A/G-specific adenine glycosylase [Porticoccaceae bacterium]
MTPENFQQALLDWFELQGRTDLPWQKPITPYRVWVSEIMLQQTQVATVIPYFKRFMQSFPTIEKLALASLDNVLHHWTGLGYYARARNLHKTAQRITFDRGQQFPDTIEQLLELPGIGRSTAGAIRSIAFNKPAAILDGNVKRVLARFAAVEGWPGQSHVQKKLWNIAELYSPNRRTADYAQAIMDMGAILCKKTAPNCNQCPLESDCKAFSQGNQADYPDKKPRKTLPVKNSLFLLLRNCDAEILLQQNPPAGLWGGLWVLPQIEQPTDLQQLCHKLGLKIVAKNSLDKRRHTFSHFHLDYQPILVDVEQTSSRVAEIDNQVWYNPKNPLSLGMPAPIKALLDT